MRNWLSAALAGAVAFSPAALMAMEYKIAVVQSLTGPVAFIGAPLTDGIRMAIDDINAKQLLGPGNTLTATFADDAGDRGQAITLVKRAAVDKDVLLMIGPTTGAIGVAAANATNDEKLPMYTTGAVRDTLKAGPWAHIITNLPEVSITYIADYAVKKLQVQNCVVMTILDNEAYVALAKGFQDYIEKEGAKVIAYEGVRQADTDFAGLALKIQSHKADCLFVSAPAAMSGNIITQFKQAGLDPSIRIIGHNSFASPDLVKSGGAAVEGVYFMADWAPGGASSPEAKAFDEAHQKRFGREPDNWAPIGYSATMVVADALRRAGPNPTREKVREAMTSTKDVPVLIGRGKLSFVQDRIPDYGMNILTVKDGKFVPAPN